MNSKRLRRCLPVLAISGLVAGPLGCAPAGSGGDASAPSWFKGNTHTHTYWSDGNASPEHAVDWYARNGYDFLVLSDHNILSRGEAWFPISTDGGRPLSPQDVEELERRFGPDWVVQRERDGQREMRLKTLPELRVKFGVDDVGNGRRAIILIEGEEITDRFEQKEVHINGLNLAELIPPQGGDSVQQVIQRNLDAVIEQGERLNRPVLAHLNHPNFRSSLTPRDVAAIEGERFFEVYNGHQGVLNHGDDETPSTERIWDEALTLRLTEFDLGVLYGMATDDSHHHHGRDATSTPGRGWVCVRADELTPDAIITAMRAGSFYASNGVELVDFGSDDGAMWLEIHEEAGVTYHTEFIGTRIRNGDVQEIGEVLATSDARRPTYRMRGDELYVRARVVSSRLHPDPFAAGDLETAWVQPVVAMRRDQ